MNKSFFSAKKLSGNLQGVTKGTKTSNDYRPEVVTSRAINKFTMNGSASTLMELQDGDRVFMINNPTAETLDGRFLIVKAPEGAKVSSTKHEKGAGRPLGFSYSSIWSRMIQMDVNAPPLGATALVDLGFMKETKTSETTSTELVPYKVAYGLQPIMNEEGTEFEPIEVDGVTYPIAFALVEPIKRVVSDDDEDDNEPEVEPEEGVEEEPKSRNRKSNTASDEV